MTITLTSAIFKNIYFWVVIVCLIIIAGGLGFYVYKFHPQVLGMISPLNTNVGNTGQLTPDETQKVLATVGKLIDLPSGETPTIATITDITKLAGQDFFKKAHNGDQVIIYTQAKKAYLYSPNMNKIIDVEPISFASSASATPATPELPTLAPTETPILTSPTPTGKPLPSRSPTP